jgi:hypothetical protein
MVQPIKLAITGRKEMKTDHGFYMIVDKKYISYSEQFVIDRVGQRIDEKCGSDSCLCVYVQFNFDQVFLQTCNESNYEFNHIIFVVFL